MSVSAEAKQGLDIAASISPLLHGHGPEIQAVALAELVSIWLAGHHPALREEVLNNLTCLVRDLAEVNARMCGLWQEQGQ